MPAGERSRWSAILTTPSCVVAATSLQVSKHSHLLLSQRTVTGQLSSLIDAMTSCSGMKSNDVSVSCDPQDISLASAIEGNL